MINPTIISSHHTLVKIKAYKNKSAAGRANLQMA
jgi:hypothetical protein